VARTKVANPYLTPEAEAILAPAEDAPALPAPEVDAAEEGGAGEFPVSYYNPKVLNERFYVAGNPYPQRFTNGRFVARNVAEETSVRAALAAYGRGKPDRWRGDDRSKEWVHRATGFRTFNEAAREDFETYHA
jgi:hypothetical protein